jgi:hypothetical protein
MRREMPEPWRGFFHALDGALTGPVSLRCLGGFVVSVCYGMPRATADVDVLSVVPHSDVQAVLNLAGKGSPLHDQYRLYLDLVTVATYPDSFEDRLTEVFAGAFQHLQIMALDPYDLALSKLERNAPHDREDVFYLAEVVPFDLVELDARYRQEMRPYLGVPEREDLTMRMWIEAITERRERSKQRHS